MSPLVRQLIISESVDDTISISRDIGVYAKFKYKANDLLTRAAQHLDFLNCWNEESISDEVATLRKLNMSQDIVNDTISNFRDISAYAKSKHKFSDSMMPAPQSSEILDYWSEGTTGDGVPMLKDMFVFGEPRVHPCSGTNTGALNSLTVERIALQPLQCPELAVSLADSQSSMEGLSVNTTMNTNITISTSVSTSTITNTHNDTTASFNTIASTDTIGLTIVNTRPLSLRESAPSSLTYQRRVNSHSTPTPSTAPTSPDTKALVQTL